MRHLASIQRIYAVEPIEGADRIEMVRVLGWQCVANKGQFKPMDLCVYFEIDSFLPVRPEFEFLRASSYKKTDIMGEGFRLRTMKFKGQVSQGLVLPLNAFPEIPADALLGTDVTELLGVKKWEIEERATTGGTVVGTLPYDVPHTDEVRCFTPNTKIRTDQGLIRIADIVNKRINCKALTYNFEKQQTEWEQITNFYKRKSVEPMCVITYPLRYNANRTNTLTGTLNHKVMTDIGWRKLEKIEPGDSVFVPTTKYKNEVIQFIAGMLLGDASLSVDDRKQKDGKLYNKHRISFTQGEKQINYLKEKLRLLNCDANIQESKSGYCNNKVYQTVLPIDDTIEQWLISLYGINNRKKKITYDYVKELTPISFALWYMDDGSLHKYKDGRNWQSQISLSTEAYSKEENEILVSRLSEYGIEAKIYETRKNEKIYYNLHLSTENTKLFENLIAPYIYPDMKYKLDEDYQNVEYALKDFCVDKINDVIHVQVLSKKIVEPNKKATTNTLYNIETESNHNYFANGILVHNCQACPELIQAFMGKEYYISTKMDGSSHSISIDESGFHVCGHNYEYRDDGTSSFYEFVKEKNFEAYMRAYMSRYGLNTLTIQGEFCAPGIQKNRLRLTKPEWYVFTVREDGKRVGLDETIKTAEAIKAKTVPIEERDMDLPSKYPTVEALLERADGDYPNGGKKEGIVVRTVEPEFCDLISAPLSMKVVSNKYLLKNE